jgi:hypothetical protein
MRCGCLSIVPWLVAAQTVMQFTSGGLSHLKSSAAHMAPPAISVTQKTSKGVSTRVSISNCFKRSLISPGVWSLTVVRLDAIGRGVLRQIPVHARTGRALGDPHQIMGERHPPIDHHLG